MEACPFLPPGDAALSAVSMRRVGQDRGEVFYDLALRCAQSLCQRGLPAQAILLLNRAFSADLTGHEPVLREWPPPYRAMRWILEQRSEAHFIGNPRRHFQHLATRMVEPRRELRSWRAWACWAIACEVFPEVPGDLVQLEREGIVEPSMAEIIEQLKIIGLPGEAELWRSACGAAAVKGA